MFVACCAAVGLVAGAAHAADVVPGGAFERLTLPGPNRACVLRVERRMPELTLVLGWPGGTRQYAARATTSAIAATADDASDANVIAAVNASFFGPPPVVIGATVTDGELLQMPSGVYDTAIVRRDGSAVIAEDVRYLPGWLRAGGKAELAIGRVNAEPEPNGVTAYTPAWRQVRLGDAATGSTVVVLDALDGPPTLGARRTAPVLAVHAVDEDYTFDVPDGGVVLVGHGTAAAALKQRCAVGESVVIRLGSAAPPLADAKLAVTGVGWLVHDGRPYRENWRQYKFADQRHPRTVLGWNRTHWLLLVVDGRSEESVGMTFAELADVLIERLEADEALNLDGGGSTTMVVAGEVRNVPSDGQERPVGNALLVVQAAPVAAESRRDVGREPATADR